MSRRLNTMLSRRWAGNSGGDPSIIYELYNYVCDGTAATAVDTGIKLFDTTAFPKGFIIEMTATSSTFTSQGSFLRCRSANQVSGTYPGCCIRWSTSSGTMQMQCNGDSKTKAGLLGATADYVIGYYPGAMGFWGINGDVSTFSARTISTNDTLCFGGEKDGNGNWKSGRYATVTIHSVKVIDLAALINDNDYPYFEALEANSTVGMTLTGTAAPALYYSTDKTNWALWDYSDITLTNVGDRIYFYGTSNALATDVANYSTFTGSGSLKVGGLLTRLIGSSPIAWSTGYEFYRLFRNCTSLFSAGNASFGCLRRIPAHSLRAMFENCSSLVDAPVLVLYGVNVYSCNSMFLNCTSLISVNGKLPPARGDATYSGMFKGCSSLIKTPELGNGETTSNWYGYEYMFRDCTSLVNAPALPRFQTIRGYYFRYMFAGCTSLVIAPEIVADKISRYGCMGMFEGCTSLQYIKCLATDISETDCITDWLKNVSPTGTFVKSASMNDWPTGDSGIPEGWTIIEATE